MLYDCGADLVCGADDVVVVSFVVGNTPQAQYSAGVLSLDFGMFSSGKRGTAPTLATGRRYKLTLEQGIFQDLSPSLLTSSRSSPRPRPRSITRSTPRPRLH